MIDALDDALRGLLRTATMLTLGALVALLFTGRFVLELPLPSLPTPQQGSEQQTPSAAGCAHVRATRCS